MKTPPPIPALAAAVLTIFLLSSAAQAQTGLKSRLNDRNRDKPTTVPATAQPAPAVPAPVPVPLAQNSTSNAPEGSVARLPAAVMKDERVSGAVDTVRARVEKEMEGRSTEDLLRAAQKGIAAAKGGSTTITDVTRPGTTTTAAPAAAPVPVAASTPPAPPKPSAPPVAPSAQPAADRPPVLANPANIPPPVPLRPKYDKEKKTGEQAMEIEADESVMDNAQRMVTFNGNVIVNHPQFKLTGDHLDVYLNEDTTIEGGQASAPATKEGADDKPPFKRAIATGSMVEIEKIGADGKTQTAKARKADYDAATGDIVLTGGPPTLQSGTSYVNSSSPDAVIILRGNGKYEVPNENGNGRTKLQIPIKGGSKGGTGGLPTGNLDSITNRNNQR